MNQKESMKKALYQAMSQMYNGNQNYTFDITFTGVVIEALENNKYKVKINDQVYETYSCNEMVYQVNNVVLITVPQGKFSNMFIIGRRR